MIDYNDNDELFEKLFGDLFKNPPTKEEIEARKREEERQRQIAMENRELFKTYANTLPGADNVREDNPIVEIRGGIDKDGNFFERAVTREEFIDEMFDGLFGAVSIDHLGSSKGQRCR